MKFLALFYSLLLLSGLSAQSPDSLQVVSPQDSLLMEQFEQTAGLTQPDSVKIDVVKLNKDVNRILEKRTERMRQEWFRWWYMDINRHYKSLQEPVLLIRKSGFTKYPFQTESMHILQSEKHFFETANFNHSLNLEVEDYDLPVMLTYADAGLGDWKHTRGLLQLYKGISPLSDSLAFSAGVNGINGYWFGDYETSANIHLNLLYKMKKGRLRFLHSTRSEEFPSALSYLSSAENLIYSANEEIIKYEHPLLEAGVRYETASIDSLDRNQFAFLLRKNNRYKSLFYDISAEYITQHAENDTSWLSLSVQTQGNINRFDFNLSLNYTGEKTWFAEAQCFLPLYSSFGITAAAYNWKNDSAAIHPETGKFSRNGAGFAWQDSLRNMQLLYGSQNDGTYDDWYLEAYANAAFNYRNFQLNLKNYTLYYILPDLQTQTEIELRYFLKHNNALRLQYRNRYYADYYTRDNQFVPAAVWHDILIGVKISRKFEIRAEFTNITENFFFMGSEQSGFTMLYNLYWYFVN